MKPLIILTGPTAVGKTDLSIKLAKKINGEIISADSVQVYKKLNIGSAKITKEEMQGIPHYLIDILEPDMDFNVYTFKELSLKAIENIYDNNHIPIIAGGTGFYIQSVLYDINFAENNDDGIRKKYEDIFAEKGVDYLYELLKKADPEYASTLHKNNVKRVIRALEFYEQTGKKISEHNKEESERNSPFDFKYFVLNDDRKILYERIDKRVDIMVENGLFDEVNALKASGISRDCISMQGIGYKEVYSFLDGEITKEEAIDQIKKNTRHFAKRQLTWFRREKETIFINKQDFNYDEDRILEHILNIIKDII